MFNRKLQIILMLIVSVIFGCTGRQAAPDAPASPQTIKHPAEAINSFTDDLFKRSIIKDKNTLISPISVSVALAMAANGASGDTLREFEYLLGSKNQLNAYYKALISSFKTDGQAEINIFNSIYVNDLGKLNKTFLENLNTYFFAVAQTGRFGDPELVEKINSDVAGTTNNLIPKIIDSLSANDKMVILNTLYFRDSWKNEFETFATKPDTFTTSSKRSVKADFMQTIAQYPVYTDAGATVVFMPYKDRRFSMMLMLPAEGKTPPDILNLARTENIAKIAENAANEHLLLRVPKFEVAAGYEYGSILKSMGLKNAFAREKADFSAMMDINPLYISQVIHKIKIIVNETGTEAAAATSITIRTTSAPMFNKEITFNRPFILAIWDNEQKVPLFLGVLENPAE